MSDVGSLGFLSASRTDCTWLYIHSAGSLLPEIALEAIEAARPRWGDASYATRMALTATIGGIPLTQSTGTGIDVLPAGSNDHPAVVIDWRDRLLHVLPAETADAWHEMDRDERALAISGAIAIRFQSLSRDRIVEMMHRQGERSRAPEAVEIAQGGGAR